MWQWRKLLPSWTQVIFFTIAILAILACGKLLPKMNEKRAEYRLTENKPLENAPPQLVLTTTALGGLRGLIIDYLWLRATELRNKGSHYEIIQLYDWIGKLEPRIPEVWSYTSWEMAYNISVTMPTPEERWRWIHKGIEQLRDYGLRYNPNSPKLYKELAQLLYDKIEMNSVDEYRFYYQKQWFYTWHSLLGATQNLKQLKDAPKNKESLLKLPQMQSLVEKFHTQAIDIFEDFWNMERLAPERKKIVMSIWEGEQNRGAVQNFVSYLRAQRMREKFKMEVEKMFALQEKYGKLDWRLASSHVLYWAEEGVKVVESLPPLQDQTIGKNLDRLQEQGLKQNFEYGKVIAVTPHRIVCIPNFALVDSLHELYEKNQQKWELEGGRESHRHFLEQVVKSYYMYNNCKKPLCQHDKCHWVKALKYFEILRRKFKDPKYEKDFESFVVLEIGRDIDFDRRHIVEDYMMSKLLEGYIDLINGILERYEGLMRWVAYVHRRYMERHGLTKDVSKFEQPHSLEYFQKITAKLLKKSLQQQQGEEYWKRVEKRFPMFASLTKED
jgi:hypothetical protein